MVNVKQHYMRTYSCFSLCFSNMNSLKILKVHVQFTDVMGDNTLREYQLILHYGSSCERKQLLMCVAKC